MIGGFMVSGRKPNLERRHQVIELRAQGLTLSEIGRQLGITRQAVHAALQSIQRAARRVITCRKCRMPIDPAGALPGDVGNTLCLICVARGRGATFGQRLKAFRLAIGLTRRELDLLGGLPSSSVQYYEQDRRCPTEATRAKLAEALGLTLDVLGTGCPVPGLRGRGRPRKHKVAPRAERGR
jgi:transcriptional regulator with XRE-family HTH domain